MTITAQNLCIGSGHGQHKKLSQENDGMQSSSGPCTGPAEPPTNHAWCCTAGDNVKSCSSTGHFIVDRHKLFQKLVIEFRLMLMPRRFHTLVSWLEGILALQRCADLAKISRMELCSHLKASCGLKIPVSHQSFGCLITRDDGPLYSGHCFTSYARLMVCPDVWVR